MRRGKKRCENITIKIIILVFLITISFLSPATADNEKSYRSIKLFTEILEELENNYVDEVDTEKLIHNAIKGMVENLDPHSAFMPAEAFERLQDDTRGKFSGIGIVITLKNGLLTVISPIEGTPAYRAGIHAGDVIVKIDDQSTNGMALWEAVKLMRGPKGEGVVITLVRASMSEPIVLTLKRDMIPLDSVKHISLKPGFGYIRITNFRKNTIDDVKKALKSLKKEGSSSLKGLILDLRHNPGGLLDQAIKISDLFLDQGKILITKGRSDQEEIVYRATLNPTEANYPVVVLINGGSASASEIVAGALQDNGRALILGTTSFGKASVQTVIPLEDGFGIKYTIARYYTPNGRSIQAKGIEPDIVVQAGMVIAKETKEETAFDRLVKEKNLVNHLEPEEKKKEGKKREGKKKTKTGLLDLETLKKDIQINRALDILISYGVFNKINGKEEKTN